MIRGGRVDVAVPGALQVSAGSDLAGWNNPARGLGKTGNIGGSMDLAVGAAKLIVTNYALIEVTPGGLLLREAVHGVTREDVKKMTAARLVVDADFHEMEL
jgi:acyl CoA:acetate/3-ketoacid CoA transferase beta subunit